MAIFKTLTCQNCQKSRQVQTEKPKGEQCPACGFMATRYSKKWSVAVYIDGRKHVESVSVSKAEAAAREATLVLKASSGELVVKASSKTLREAVETFQLWCQEQVESKRLDEKTAFRYLSALKTNVLPFLGNINISRIDHLEVDEYVRHRLSTVPKPQPATINRELTALSRLLTIMVRKRVIIKNLMEGYPKLPEPKTRERCLTSEEIQRLLAACSDKKAPAHLYTMVVVALNTGLRKEGVLGLRWEHIDWKSNVITREVKAGRTVKIPMSDTLRAALLAWRSSRPVSIGGWVFPSTKKPTEAMLVSSNIGFDSAVKRAGIGEFVYHELRHCFLTHLIMATKNIQLAADIAGHSSIWITQRYTHLLDSFKAEEMKKFRI